MNVNQINSTKHTSRDIDAKLAALEIEDSFVESFGLDGRDDRDVSNKRIDIFLPFTLVFLF